MITLKIPFQIIIMGTVIFLSIATAFAQTPPPSSLPQNNPAIPNTNNPAMVNPSDPTGANSSLPGSAGSPPSSTKPSGSNLGDYKSPAGTAIDSGATGTGSGSTSAPATGH